MHDFCQGLTLILNSYLSLLCFSRRFHSEDGLEAGSDAVSDNQEAS